MGQTQTQEPEAGLHLNEECLGCLHYGSRCGVGCEWSENVEDCPDFRMDY